MKRRNFLKGLVVTPAIIAGCKAVTMPTDKLIKASVDPRDDWATSAGKHLAKSDIKIDYLDAGGHTFFV